MKRIQQSAVLKHLGMTGPESEQRGVNPPLAQVRILQIAYPARLLYVQ